MSKTIDGRTPGCRFQKRNLVRVRHPESKWDTIFISEEEYYADPDAYVLIEDEDPEELEDEVDEEPSDPPAQGKPKNQNKTKKVPKKRAADLKPGQKAKADDPEDIVDPPSDAEEEIEE